MSEPRRPLSLTITAVGIFLLAMWNFWRAWMVAQQRALLQELEATLDPRMRLALALLWGIVFLSLAVGLWRRQRAVRKALPAALLCYGVMHLILLFLFAPAPAARLSWPLQVLALLLATGWTTWVCLRKAHHDVWRPTGRPSDLNFTLSPFTFKVVQRGYDGESKD